MQPSLLFLFSLFQSSLPIFTCFGLLQLIIWKPVSDWCLLLASRTRILVMTATVALSIIKKVKRQEKEIK